MSSLKALGEIMQKLKSRLSFFSSFWLSRSNVKVNVIGLQMFFSVKKFVERIICGILGKI